MLFLILQFYVTASTLPSPHPPPHWTDIPGIGEADNPGPEVSDDPDACMSEFSDDPQIEPSSPGAWELPPSENVAGDSQPSTSQPSPLAVADRIAAVEANLVRNWLEKHKYNEFVAASGGEAVTKKIKFEGERPGWVFKRGLKGLGYYRDYGGMVVAVSLARALNPTEGIQPNRLQLDELISSSNPLPATTVTSRINASMSHCTTPILRTLTAASAAIAVASASQAAATNMNNVSTPGRPHQYRHNETTTQMKELSATANSFNPGHQCHMIGSLSPPSWLSALVGTSRQRPTACRKISLARALTAAPSDAPIPTSSPPIAQERGSIEDAPSVESKDCLQLSPLPGF